MRLLNSPVARPFSRFKTRRCLSLSAVNGPLHPPLNHKTLSKYFREDILENYSGRPALVCRQELPRAHGGPPSRNLNRTRHLAWDFEEFGRHINALARGLLQMGVSKGDRVAVVMGNNRQAIFISQRSGQSENSKLIRNAPVGLCKRWRDPSDR
jgi:hypothetical protein